MGFSSLPLNSLFLLIDMIHHRCPFQDGANLSGAGKLPSSSFQASTLVENYTVFCLLFSLLTEHEKGEASIVVALTNDNIQTFFSRITEVIRQSCVSLAWTARLPASSTVINKKTCPVKITLWVKWRGDGIYLFSLIRKGSFYLLPFVCLIYLLNNLPSEMSTQRGS